MYVSTDHFLGIDKNPFAVEVAKVTMMLAKKLSADELDDNLQVLPLEQLDDIIVAADALFTPWPKADVIIGNPPYLGRRKMIRDLGADYCQRLSGRYPQIGGVSDFVTYWFPLAHDHLPDGGRAGLVATNSIRQNESREVSLDYIVDNQGVIFDAVSSQPWSGDAKVYVSIVNWRKNVDVNPKILWLNNGQLRLEVDSIPSSLSPQVDVRKAKDLAVNMKPALCFQGQTPGITDGYVINRETRQELLTRDASNGSVIHPFLGGRELLHATSINKWIIDVPFDDVIEADARASGAMAHLRREVLPERQRLVEREKEENAKGAANNPKFKPENQHQNFMARWWQLWRRRPEMLATISTLDRYIACSRVSGINRFPIFAFVDSSIRPGDSLSVFGLEDDYSFGILNSDLHVSWFRARCSTFKGDPRYTPTTVWNTFPWPQSATENRAESIAQIAASIIELREQYLNRGISLAKQYDALRGPGKSKLRDLHAELDAAVRVAYGFNTDDDSLAQLLALNQDVAASIDTAYGPGPRDMRGLRISEACIRPPAE